MLDFRIDPKSGVPPYAQIVQQVKQALRLGWLLPGDKLPTVNEVASSIVINPNTVQKAYKELEQEGLVQGRPGLGTYIQRDLTQASQASLSALGNSLRQWILKARSSGLDDAGIMDLINATLKSAETRASA